MPYWDRVAHKGGFIRGIVGCYDDPLFLRYIGVLHFAGTLKECELPYEGPSARRYLIHKDFVIQISKGLFSWIIDPASVYHFVDHYYP